MPLIWNAAQWGQSEREREGGVMTPTTLSDMLYGPTNSCNCSRSFSCLSSLFHGLALGLSTCFLFALCARVKAMCEERERRRERGGRRKEREMGRVRVLPKTILIRLSHWHGNALRVLSYLASQCCKTTRVTSECWLINAQVVVTRKVSVG